MGKGVYPVEALSGDGNNDDDICAKEEKDKEEEEGPASAARFPPGPRSVLELGCGDVPLSRDIRDEFIIMEDDTGVSAHNMVDRIVCADYSGIVIDALRGEQRKERGEGGGKGCGQGGKQRRKGEGG